MDLRAVANDRKKLGLARVRDKSCIGALGPTSSFDPRSEQKHQLFAAIKKEISAHWDLAISFGRGLTASSDRAVLATRLEYRVYR